MNDTPPESRLEQLWRIFAERQMGTGKPPLIDRLYVAVEFVEDFGETLKEQAESQRDRKATMRTIRNVVLWATAAAPVMLAAFQFRAEIGAIIVKFAGGE